MMHCHMCDQKATGRLSLSLRKTQRLRRVRSFILLARLYRNEMEISNGSITNTHRFSRFGHRHPV